MFLGNIISGRKIGNKYRINKLHAAQNALVSSNKVNSSTLIVPFSINPSFRSCWLVMLYSDTRSFGELLNVDVSYFDLPAISHDSMQLSIAFLRLVALARGLEWIGCRGFPGHEVSEMPQGFTAGKSFSEPSQDHFVRPQFVKIRWGCQCLHGKPQLRYKMQTKALYFAQLVPLRIIWNEGGWVCGTMMKQEAFFKTSDRIWSVDLRLKHRCESFDWLNL